VSDFRKSCTECGDCVDVCPFLSEFGTPQKILLDCPEVAFHCTSCRRCEAACPLNLSPSAAFLETKERLIREGQISSPVRKAMQGALTFAKAGHGFPFSFYGSADTVFWPGCGLAANRPRLVRKICNILSRELQRKIGLVLDCCYDPVFTMGDTNTTFAALQDINKRLHDDGVKKVITGCLNCHKLLLEHLNDIQVVFILEALPVEVFKQHERGLIYLHHPCPSSRWEGIRNAAQGVVNQIHQSDHSSDPKTDFKSIDNEVPASAPLCCGVGGGLSSLSPELADHFLSRIIREGTGRTIMTYCTGCQNRFLKRGVKAVHLLECLAGAKPRRGVPSPLRQWSNRLALATLSRLKTPKFLGLFGFY
jgi:Fe-S oxidoreductase